ncbi:DNA-directed RNA polymerase subunit omega [Atopostipes suicloacalis DSM 15692]|uniref:DNA-directed RNA polymerase subunit omega n=1 Tax=Atopostipes suicloacalis DSM 15692 TaxID=1121025 RepID=A0A1M4VVR1_9LACT|nr:DNA-directed RNA polymerase subunit omega [Atopostipes suicloacalis]SHE73027.1 DNA-directed RNA polymerase subunit omega [Atopostipes suicloacalis DSM 15692]
MLIRPSIDKLLKQVDSKYSLVILASKRAHQLEEKEDKNHRELLDDYQSISYVGKALEEIASGDIVIDPESVKGSNL